MNWIQVNMGSFLKERKQRFNPQDKEISGLQRIEKIDFSGKIYLSDKPSRTKMILIKNNDLVISGINVSKGAMNVYYGEKDILATIHYSSYVYDKKKIDIHFLQYFLKSAEFKLLLKNQIPGGIKTEIKPKHLLPLKVFIPSKIEDQRKIAIDLNHQTLKIQSLKDSINYQNQLLSKLKQSILQDAIKGKLTKDWRQENSNIETVSKLFERIKAKKEQLVNDRKAKKEKTLPPITEEQIPFELPSKWVWCRFSEISKISRGGSPRPIGSYITSNEDGINWIKIGDTKGDNKYIKKTSQKIKPEGMKKSRFVEPGDFLLTNSMSFGKPFIMKTSGCIHDGWLLIRYDKKILKQDYLYYLLSSTYIYSSFKASTQGAVVQNLNIDKVKSTIIPIPPFEEQNEIIKKIESLIQKCDQLEEEIKKSEANAEILMQSVLKEAFNNQ